MKKSLMITIVTVALSLQAVAQDNGSTEPRKMDRMEMIQRRTEYTASRYGLDDSQKAKLLELNTKYADMMPMMGPRRGGPGGMGPGQGRPRGQRVDGDRQGQQSPSGEMRQGRGNGGGRGHFRPDPEKMQQYETELQNIMTKEQYTKYQDDRKAMMERIGQRRNMERRQN